MPSPLICLFLGFLQGAYFEGLDVAMEIAGCIQKGQCDGFHDTQVVNAQEYPSSLIV